MSGIVLELQRDALNSEVDIVLLLEKAFLIAKKLDLKDFEEWINSELSGYKDNSKCPEYRYVAGEMKYWNHFHGWHPVIYPETNSNVVYTHVLIPIASLAPLAKTDATARAPQPCINQDRVTIQPYLCIASNIFAAIIATTRHIVLNWAIDLEKKGISGDGLSFTFEEKESATAIHLTCYLNLSDVNNTQIQINAKDSLQNLADITKQ